MRVFAVKLGTFILLLVLAAGILCPSQITILKTDNDTLLLALNVCSEDAPSLSADSGIPALITPFALSLVPPQSKFIYGEHNVSYKFLSSTKLLKPPRA